MLETILSRIILRYANRYICNSFHTDTFSLWGGDLVIQNFELRTDELAHLLGAAGENGLRLVRGFVRELRIHVPWNAIRSQSLRIEVDAVEVVFAQSELRTPKSPPAGQKSPDALSTPAAAGALVRKHSAPAQEGLDEAGETWLRPLLNAIFGNIAVVANNLVAKLPRGGAVGCLTVGRLDSLPHSPRWAAGFNPVTGPQPMLYRAVSVRDISVMLDHAAHSEKRQSPGLVRRAGRLVKPGTRTARLTPELPVLHRVSVEVFIEWPLLPWVGPVNPPPASRIDVHLSPIRGRLSSDQLQLLARLLRPEYRHTTSSTRSEADSGSDQPSLRSLGRFNSNVSESSTAATGMSATVATSSAPQMHDDSFFQPVSRQVSSIIEGGQFDAAPEGLQDRAGGVSQEQPTFSEDSGRAGDPPTGPTAPDEQKTSGGFRGLLSDVFFGADDEEANAENESKTNVPREVRRSLYFAACVPLFAFSFEHNREIDASRDMASPINVREAVWLGTVSFIGLSCYVVVPPCSDELPLEGSVELHHIALQTPGSDSSPVTAIAWGSPLSRSPLDAGEHVPYGIDGVARARAWAETGRQLLEADVEFPHSSHRMIALEGLPLPDAGASTGQAAVRAGLLLISPLAKEPGVKEEGQPEELRQHVQCEVFRVSAQFSVVNLHLELRWLTSVSDALPVLLACASAFASNRTAVAAVEPCAAASEVSDTVTNTCRVLELVVASAGLCLLFDTFVLECGQIRADWRQSAHGLDEAHLAAKMRETTVFLSSVFTHLTWHSPSQTSLDCAAGGHDGSIGFARFSSLELRRRPADGLSLEVRDVDDKIAHLVDLVVVLAMPDLGALSDAEPSAAHVEIGLASASCSLKVSPVVGLLRFAEGLACIFFKRHMCEAASAPPNIAAESGEVLVVKICSLHLVLRMAEHAEQDAANSSPGLLRTALGWAGSFSRRGDDDDVSGLFSSDTEVDETPLLEHLPQPYRFEQGRHTLRTRQLLFLVRRVNICYSDSDGQGCVVLAPYDLRPHLKLLEMLPANGPDSAAIKHSRHSMLSMVCQLCPVAPPSVHRVPPKLKMLMPPPEGVFGADLVDNRRQCCFVWLSALHIQVDPRWIAFVLKLVDLVSCKQNVPGQTPPADPVTESPPESLAEAWSKVALCSISGAALPISIWFTLPSQPVACLTSPLLLASNPHIQANGLYFDVFEQQFASSKLPLNSSTALNEDLSYPLPEHSLQQLRQCFDVAQRSESDLFIADAAVTGECLSLSRLTVVAWRRELHKQKRPEVSLEVQLHLSPLQFCVQPSHVASLSHWTRSLKTGKAGPVRSHSTSEAERHDLGVLSEAQGVHKRGLSKLEPHDLQPCSSRPDRLRLTFSVTASASIYGKLLAPVGSLALQLPGLTGSIRHISDATQHRSRMTMRLSRLHLVLVAPPIPAVDVVEWCEEKVYGDDGVGQSQIDSQRRSAFWLVLSMRQQWNKPLELTVSSLPMGLCLPLAPLCRVMAAFVPPVGLRCQTSEGTSEPSVSCPAEESMALVRSTSSQGPGGGNKLSTHISLSAVSVRLFADSPFEAGTAHLAVCIAEASVQQGVEDPLRLRAVISVSLFEQPISLPPGTASNMATSAICLVDDFVRPCTITFSNRSVADEVSGARKLVEVDCFVLELSQRSHLCTLLLLGNKYLHCLDDLASVVEGGRMVSVSSESVSVPVAVESRNFCLTVHSIAVHLPGQQPDDAVYHLAVHELNFASSQHGISSHISLHSRIVKATLHNTRQTVQITGVGANILRHPARMGSLVSEVDITINIEGGISGSLATGYIFSDVWDLWPSEFEQDMFAASHRDVLEAAHELPRAAQPPREDVVSMPVYSVEEGARTSLKWRLLVSSIECYLQTSAADARCLSLSAMNFSIFSWPQAYIEAPVDSAMFCKISRSSMDILVESLSVFAGGPGIPKAPLLSPFGIDGSVMTLMPLVADVAGVRTEVRLHISPVFLSAGAWQIRLLADIFSFSHPIRVAPPDDVSYAPHAEEGPVNSSNPFTEEQVRPDTCPRGGTHDAEITANDDSVSQKLSFEYAFMELGIDGGSGGQCVGVKQEQNSHPGLPHSFAVPVLCSVPIEELEPWQAVQLPDEAGDGCPRLAIRLDRPAFISQVAARTPHRSPEQGGIFCPGLCQLPHGFAMLTPVADFDVEAWDDVQGCFVSVTNASPEAAVCSHLVALRLHSLIGVPCFRALVCIAVPLLQPARISTSELAVHIAMPRLTWSVLHTGVAPLTTCGPSVPPLEESFGDIVFHSLKFVFWRAVSDGMIIRVESAKTGIDLYDMSTLSLVPVVAPHDNHIAVSVHIAQSKAPRLVPLRTAPHRSAEKCVYRPVIDVSLGAWCLQLPPWAIARMSCLGQSMLTMMSFKPCMKEGDCQVASLSSQLPIVIQNGLPIPIMFGQTGASELLTLLPDAERGYAWKQTDVLARSLVFALGGEAPVSMPLSFVELPRDSSSWWACLELKSSARKCGGSTCHLLYVCVQRVSMNQCRVMLIPPVLLLSYLRDATEFSVLQDSEEVPCSTNSILGSERFMRGLPSQERSRKSLAEVLRQSVDTLPKGMSTQAPSGPSGACTLPPCTFVGAWPSLNSPCSIHFRKALQPWGPQLPLSVDQMEPYTTLLPLSKTEHVMCKCHDLWGGARSESLCWFAVAGDAPRMATLQPLTETALPNVLQLWPLLIVENRCPFNISVCASSMGITDVAAGSCRILEAASDPRQLTAIEIRVFPGAETASIGSSDQVSLAASSCNVMLSSGPLLISSLTQFSHREAGETVSWQNAVRCKGTSLPASEMLLLVELRRCSLSSILRSIMIEPMWSVQNDVGEDVFLGSPDSEDMLHVATNGRSVTATLGDIQIDPSCPLLALFGLRHPAEPSGIVWSRAPQKCPMGKTTRVEIEQSHQRCVLLVSVTPRWQYSQDIKACVGGGGVDVRIYAAAYVRSEIDCGLCLAMGSPGEADLHIPAAPAGQTVAVPWNWWPVMESTIIHNLVSDLGSESPGGLPNKVALQVRLDDGGKCGWSEEVPLSLTCARGSRQYSSASAIASLSALLKPSAQEVICSGHARDVQVDTTGSPLASILLNATYQLHGQGCFILTLLRCTQPPLVCTNFTKFPAYINRPWHGDDSAPMSPGFSVSPGATLEVSAPVLRTMEVFPSEGAGSPEDGLSAGRGSSRQEERSAASLVHTCVTLEPSATDRPQYLEIALTMDADIPWELLGFGFVLVIIRYASGCCRVELRELPDDTSKDASALPTVQPPGSEPLPISADVSIEIQDLIVHVLPSGGVSQSSRGSASQVDVRRLTLHALGLVTHLRFEGEDTSLLSGRAPASRICVSFRSKLLSLADIGRLAPAAPFKQVFALPPLDLDVCLFHPSHGLQCVELLSLMLIPVEGYAQTIMVCLDDSFIEFVQGLVTEIAAELRLDSYDNQFADRIGFGYDGDALPAAGVAEIPPVARAEFRYLFVRALSISQLPLYVDLQLSSQLFVSFTGLEITFPETRLAHIGANSFVLGQEFLAHCIAFLLLNSPFLLGSCDLLGNPVQAYKHLKYGIGDVLHRPLREGFRSLARHIGSASLTSASALADSLRRNLPLPAATQMEDSHAAAAAASRGGLGAGLRALAGGFGRGLSGVVYWEQHTPHREGALGQLRGATNAVTGALTQPVGGFLDLVTTTARGWTAPEASVAPPQLHAVGCQACLAQWSLHPEPDVSPLKFHLQCCQGLPPPLGSAPALLYWSPYCEMVRVDGAGRSEGHKEPNLRLIRAGLLLTTAQICILVDECTAHALDIGAVQAVEESPGRPSSLVTIASTCGRIWQLHVRGEPGEFIAQLRRARRLSGFSPGAV